MKRALLFLCVAAACASAQGPGMFPWWDSPLVKDLNLSEDQQKQIDSTVRDHRDKLIEQRAAVQKAEGALQDALNKDPVDEPKAREAIEKLIAARGDLMRTMSHMGLKLRAVLTPQQWQELQRRRRGRMFQEGWRERPGRWRSAPGAGPPAPAGPPRPPEPPPPGLDEDQ